MKKVRWVLLLAVVLVFGVGICCLWAAEAKPVAEKATDQAKVAAKAGVPAAQKAVASENKPLVSEKGLMEKAKGIETPQQTTRTSQASGEGTEPGKRKLEDLDKPKPIEDAAQERAGGVLETVAAPTQTTRTSQASSDGGADPGKRKLQDLDKPRPVESQAGVTVVQTTRVGTAAASAGAMDSTKVGPGGEPINPAAQAGLKKE